jgi:hypothetical protein
VFLVDGINKKCTWEWNTNSGRSSRCMFHTATMPSGSFRAAGFLLYDATLSSGYYETILDAVRSVSGASGQCVPWATNPSRLSIGSCSTSRPRTCKHA